MLKSKKGRIIVISGAFLVLALFFYWIKLDFWQHISLLAATVIAGYQIVYKAWQSASMKVFSIEQLVSIAVIGALVIGESMESAVVTFLFIFGAYLEARTLEKTRLSIKSLLEMAPMEATVLKNGEFVTIPAEEVEKGDRVRIRSGEKVAIDGIVASGYAFINEASITGESVLAAKQQGDQVFSGTIIDNGYLEVMAEKVGEETIFSKIIELVEEAQDTKAKTEKFIDTFSSFYTPAIIVLSIIVYLFTKNFEMAITFLVIACPGALVISVPVSIVAGIGNSAKNGVLIKGGDKMENLAKVDAVVFDKTGTLTKGKPEVTAIAAFGMSENELLKIAAEAERISEHHLGRTIVQEAKNRKLNLEHKPTDFQVIKGNGLTATLHHQNMVIGNRNLLNGLHIKWTKEVETYAADQEKNGHTAIFVAANGQMRGVISIADQIRHEAFDTIQQLKMDGVKQIFMLTGDNKRTAEKVAKQLGIDQVFAELLPEDKVTKVKELKQKGYTVAMVGDGINDAPAIALADIGIAMGASGTDVAMETADVAIMADQLEKIAYARKLAQATVLNLKQNIYFAVAVVFILLAGVLSNQIFLASGMFIHELSVLIVILNAMRLVRYNEKRKKSQKPHYLAEVIE